MTVVIQLHLYSCIGTQQLCGGVCMSRPITDCPPPHSAKPHCPGGTEGNVGGGGGLLREGVTLVSTALELVLPLLSSSSSTPSPRWRG